MAFYGVSQRKLAVQKIRIQFPSYLIHGIERNSTLKGVYQMQMCMVLAEADGLVDENFRQFAARL